MGAGPQEVEQGADNGALIPIDAAELDGGCGIHLASPAREKTRPDSPPWRATATSDQPIQLSLFG
jgi:hypothetical protein